MIFAAVFDRFIVDFMFDFVSWPSRPDKRRTHTEHTQSNFLRASRSFGQDVEGVALVKYDIRVCLYELSCKSEGSQSHLVFF